MLKRIYICLITLVCFIAPTYFAYAANNDAISDLSKNLEIGSKLFCNTEHLNLRETPTMSDDNILLVLNEGDNLFYLGYEDEDWVHVQTNEGVIGYCGTRFLSVLPTAQASDLPKVSTTPTVSATPKVSVTPTPLLPAPSQSIPSKTSPNKPTPSPPRVYTDYWAKKSVVEKLSDLPVWLYFIISAGLIFVVLYRLFIGNK